MFQHFSQDATARKGRWWFHSHPASFAIEWTWFTRHIHVGIEFDPSDDYAVSLSLGCGLFAVWLCIGIRALDSWLYQRMKSDGREIKVTIHDGAIWWGIWSDKWGWSSRTPKWRQGNFNPADFFLGRPKYADRTLSHERVNVPMPEGGYPATVRIFESTWKRPRSPFTRKLVRTEITPDKPIPFPGKGENSWDCGEDATHSMTCPEPTALGAAIALSESVMRSRIKYGSGWNYQPEEARQ